MRTLFCYLLISLLSFGLFCNEAAAKRFGGGRSFGVQRSHSSLFQSHSAQKSSAYKTQNTKSRWGGVLGGMLVGGLLASLFMGHGFANGIMTWLILAAAVFFIVNFFRRKMNPAFQSMHAQGTPNNVFNPFNQSGSSYTVSNSAYPSGFSSEQFVRQAKVQFIRLQAAYDQGNLQDLSTFTAPEVFAEIQMQLDERGDLPNTTEVLRLDAELLDASKQASTMIASVRFTGSLKENGELTPLDEIWHFRQFQPNGEWVVGGVQQEVVAPV